MANALVPWTILGIVAAGKSIDVGLELAHADVGYA
jgi:hypothetical protein